MKKILIVASSICFIISCGNNNSGGNDKKTDSTTTVSNSAASNEDPEAKKGLALIAKNDCLTCHKLNEASTGPAYALVAERYKDKPGSMDSLADKIIKGGSGNWGTIPMTQHPTLSKEDALTMVHYVMSVKK